jgi:hypothetical protein
MQDAPAVDERRMGFESAKMDFRVLFACGILTEAKKKQGKIPGFIQRFPKRSSTVHKAGRVRMLERQAIKFLTLLRSSLQFHRGHC